MRDKKGSHGEIVVAKGNPSSEDQEAKITKVTANAVYYTTLNRVKELRGDYTFFDRAKSELSGDGGGWNKSWNTAKYKATFNVTVKKPLNSEDELTNKLIENPVSNYLTIIDPYSKEGSKAGGRFMRFRTTQRTPPNSVAHENGHNWGLKHNPNYKDFNTGKSSIMSYQADRAVTLRDVEDILDPAVELANRVDRDIVIIHLFANEGANGTVSRDYNTYKVYNPETKAYEQSITIEAKKYTK